MNTSSKNTALSSVRNLILNPSSNICVTSTISSLFFEQIVVNMKFLTLVLVVILGTMCIAGFVYIEPRLFRGRNSLYFIGLSIFITAIIIKISCSIVDLKALDLDSKLYNLLTGSESSAGAGGILLAIIGALNRTGKASTCEVDKINGNDHKSFLVGEVSQDSSKLATARPEISSGTARVNIRDTDSSRQGLRLSKREVIKIDLRNPLIFKAVQQTVSTRPVLETETQTVTKVQSKPHSESKTSSIDKISFLEHAITVKNSNTANFEDESETDFKHTQTTLNNEFTSNNKISVGLKEMNKSLNSVEIEANKLDQAMKKFIKNSSKIEQEMKSFDASAKHFERLREAIMDALKKTLNLKNLLKNLNFKESTDSDLNKIFKVEEPHSEPSESNSGEMLIMSLQVHVILELVLYLILFYQGLTGGRAFLLKMMLCVFLIGNVIFSPFLMIKTHLLDRDCILGRVPGCGAYFKSDFVEFSRSANLDLRSHEFDKLKESFDKIDQRTQAEILILKEFFLDSPLEAFYNQGSHINDLFERIRFVKEDFKELTHSKVDKNEFFSVMDEIDVGLAQISNDLESVKKNFLLDLFMKEVVFGNFIKNQKERIVASAEKQVEERNRQTMNKIYDECEIKRKKLCEKKDTLDYLWALLMFGSPFMMLTLAFA